MTISRRSLIIGISAVGCAVRSTAAVDLLRPTPQETFGPFFPVHTPQYHDFDMTRIPGRAGHASGQVIDLSGRVLRTDGSIVKGARMEIWQANAAGRYEHPIDKNPAPLDPNFDGDMAGERCRPLRTSDRQEPCASRSQFRRRSTLAEFK